MCIDGFNELDSEPFSIVLPFSIFDMRSRCDIDGCRETERSRKDFFSSSSNISSKRKRRFITRAKLPLSSFLLKRSVESGGGGVVRFENDLRISGGICI